VTTTRAEGTLHIDAASQPYVEMEPGLEYRLLHVRASDQLVVTQIRAQPFAVSKLHRHLAPVFGLTQSGVWGHDDQYLYRPGTYVYETPGVLHRFMNGPQVTEATFISLGDMEYVDAASMSVTGVASPDALVAAFAAALDGRTVDYLT
jgi:2,4'-dihydroxyacetophenone dioxygenase